MIRPSPLPAAAWLLAVLLTATLATGCDPVIKRRSAEPDSKTQASASKPSPAPVAPQAPASVQVTPSAPVAPAPAPVPPARDRLESTAKKLAAVPSQVFGGDVSWPQCPRGMGIPQKRSEGLPMPTPEAHFVVIGLTNGPGFVANPCLADQVGWVRDRQLMAAAYSVLSWPDTATLARYGSRGPFDSSSRTGAPANVGFQQARFNIASMKRAGLSTPVVWLDVENVPGFPWSTDPVANAAVVRGAARGYRDAGFKVGVYSTQYGWKQLVGSLRLGLPEWRAAGQTSLDEALRRCGPERIIQGGKAVLSQWVESGRDRDVTCPGTSAQLSAWFHQY